MKKILLVAVCLLISGCVDRGTQMVKNKDQNRMQIKSNETYNGFTFFILHDTKTGREFLGGYNFGLVEIKPKGE